MTPALSVIEIPYERSATIHARLCNNAAQQSILFEEKNLYADKQYIHALLK
jgi:hypothetical protein